MLLLYPAIPEAGGCFCFAGQTFKAAYPGARRIGGGGTSAGGCGWNGWMGTALMPDLPDKEMKAGAAKKNEGNQKKSMRFILQKRMLFLLFSCKIP